MKKYPVSRKANLVVQEMDGEVLIYDLTENKAFCLNETSSLVWQLCDGNKTVAEISQTLEQKLNSPANEDLVWFAIDQLKKEKLIENEAELGNHFAGMSRREVIKKVGLGSMIALPIVASLIAPLAIQAASACNTGTVCTCTIGGQAAGGSGMACAPAGTGGCVSFTSSGMSCTCLATNSGVPVSPGTCGLV